MQAYDEFTAKHAIQPRILHDRLGLLEKQPEPAQAFLF